MPCSWPPSAMDELALLRGPPRWTGLIRDAKPSTIRISGSGNLRKADLTLTKVGCPVPGPNSESEPYLLDHLVGAGQQRSWNVEADLFRGLEVPHQFEPGRLFDRQVGWLFLAPLRILSTYVAARRDRSGKLAP